MSRRVAAALLALALAAAPSLLATCKIRCLSSTTDRSPSTTPQGHSCHETMPKESAALSAGLHVCGHSNAGIQSVEKLSQPIAGPVVIAESFAPFFSVETYRVEAHLTTWLPNGPPLLHQLRI